MIDFIKDTIKGEFIRIVELCQDSAGFELWQAVLICSAIFLLDCVIFGAMWYCRYDTAIKVGYSAKQSRKLEAEFKSKPFADKILLYSVTRSSAKRGPMLWINLFCHYINLLGLLLCFIGFCGGIVTLGDGWTLVLLLYAELWTLFITVTIEFIPHLLWVPTERKRYKFW